MKIKLELGLTDKEMGIDGAVSNQSDLAIRLGICCMEKKLKSRPMRQILSYLEKAGIVIIRFTNDLLLNKPIEEWPRCDVLIGFYSSGFPLKKAISYVD